MSSLPSSNLSGNSDKSDSRTYSVISDDSNESDSKINTANDKEETVDRVEYRAPQIQKLGEPYQRIRKY